MAVTNLRTKICGQVLVEFAASAVILLALSAGIIILTLTTLGSAWLKIETFALARANLYGQASCQPSRAGKNLEPLTRFEYQCKSSGLVTANVAFNQTHESGKPLTYMLNLRSQLQGVGE